MNKWLTEMISTTLEEVATKELPPGVIMQVRGKFGHAGRITENRRLYTRKLMQREINGIQKKIQERAVLGETDHPGPVSGGVPSLRRTALIITGLGMNEGGEIMGEADVVDTVAGRDFAVLVRAGAQVGMSSRGRGTSRPSRMTSSHPDYAQNKDWDGQEFEEVDESFSLRTFDAVIDQAVADAYIGDYNESETEENMKLEDILKSEELMAGLLDSDAVKAKVEEAVKAKAEELEKVHEEDKKEYIKKLIMSDEFADKVKVAKEDKDGDEEKLEEVKCPECQAAIPQGAKFCPACGVRSAPAAKEQTQDEKDKVIEDLSKRLEALEQSIKEKDEKVAAMEQKEKEREDGEAVEAAVAEALEGQPKLIVEAVRKDLEDLELTPENAKEITEGKVEKTTNLIKASGGSLSNAKGKGKVIYNDDDADKEKEKKDKTEQRSKDKQMLDSLD